MFGFLNVYKPAGITSHDVVSCLRRVTKIKQIGHTGTLDPFAEGLLLVCIGKATRLIEYLDDDKAYTGVIQLGSATDTYDKEGKIIKTSDKMVTKTDIESALIHFTGEIEQLPPIYSAIKVNGKKLYQYAREGKEVKIEPRRVNISSLEILDFDEANRQVTLHIECSKGTYIRSIANDLGEKLGTYGHLIKLIRTKVGDFKVNDSIKLDELDTYEKVQSNLINPVQKIKFPEYKLTQDEKDKVSRGMPVNYTGDFRESSLVKLTFQNELAAIARTCQQQLKCEKVLV